MRQQVALSSQTGGPASKRPRLCLPHPSFCWGPGRPREPQVPATHARRRQYDATDRPSQGWG